ncbi:MAG: DNA polymerase III subunit delta' [Schwartzia sp.]|nr:DNA polymerase III subunit delta' [Schwartzia sp. (in: firmicutes)]
METSWEGILGQEEAVGRLKRMLAENRLPHALLFYGPDGVGKRRTAQALAAALLCMSSEDGEPCGQCGSCRAMADGTHPDFYVVEPESAGRAAKSIKIEQIRELEREIGRVPKLSQRRAVLMDSVERMNEAAQNSLLKTLEEPTGDVVFILVTSAKQALLDTIVSRCLLLPFAPLKEETLVKLLGVRGISESDAQGIAPLSGGSLGRAVRLLDEGALSIRDEVLGLLKRFKNMPLSDVWTEGERLGKCRQEELADRICYLRLLIRDMLALYSGAEVSQKDLAGELGRLLSDFSEARLFELMELTKELERRITGSNANARLQIEAYLIRACGNK